MYVSDAANMMLTVVDFNRIMHLLRKIVSELNTITTKQLEDNYIGIFPRRTVEREWLIMVIGVIAQRYPSVIE